MSHAYQDSRQDIIDSHKRIHSNGEETHIHVLSAGERYAVVAFDVDPREYDAVDAECVAYTPTVEAAQERAQAWMEQHPKGVAGGSGTISKLIGMIAQADKKATENMQEDNQ